MFEILSKIIKPAIPAGVIGQLEQLCGDEMYHGQNQALSSMEELVTRLSFSEEKSRKPVCFVVDCTGFWESELSRHWTISKIASQEELEATRIPVYIYALKEGAGYKVAYSSRYLAGFENKDYGYYSEVLSDLAVHSVDADISSSLMLKRATYSSDLLSIIRHYESKGQVHAVYRLV